MHLFFLRCKKGKNTMKKALSILLLAISLLTLSAAEIRGKVVAITDGDTIKVLDDLDKGVLKIRLNKIDAPEKKQAFGQKSKQYLSNLVFGKQVIIRFKEIDRYGRILGLIYINGVEVNLQMVKAGMAWHYSYYDKTPAYIEAEKKARASKVGLWIDPEPISPYEFRKSRKSR